MRAGIKRAIVAIVSFALISVLIYPLIMDIMPPTLHAKGYQDGGSGFRGFLWMTITLFGTRWITRRIVPIRESADGPKSDN